jgi:dTDP-glucose pyrophosphorylase/CBS domain-containing protein
MLSVPIDGLFVKLNTPIRTALLQIDKGGVGIVLVVDEERHLLGTVTDGDVRRAILSSTDLDTPVSILLERKKTGQYPKPVTAIKGTSRDELLLLMQKFALREIPLLDDDERVVDLIGMDDLVPVELLSLQAVIMAGGFGSRLRPLTEDMPKPMLPVGGRPLMEVLLEQLRDSGIRNVSVTTHFKPEKISDYFGDGKKFGVNLNYINEEHPLGTGGALGLLQRPSEPLLVINGDVLTQVDFRAMYAFHQEYKADLTLAVRQYDFEVPYGVIESNGVFVKGIQEKPRFNFFVNAGIYLLQPDVYEYIPAGKRFNMTDLIQWLMDAGHVVVNFPVREYWLDIGQHADYAKAQKDVEDGLMTTDHPENKKDNKGSQEG